MKKFPAILKISFAIIAVIFSFMLARTFFVPFQSAAIWQENKIPTPENFAKHAKRLSGGLQIPTVSNADIKKTDFSKFAKFRNYLQQEYPIVFKNVSYKIIDENAMLLVWKGTNPDLNPILFNTHYDVVPAGGWADAFSGAQKDGRIYGRGAIDIKSTLFAIMGAAEELMAQGFQPQRDIYFAFGHDEETKQNASKEIAEYLKSKGLFFDAVYDEGGIINLMDVGGRQFGFAFIGIAEKGYLTLNIKVLSNAGHSSMPPRETTIGNAAVIVRRLERNQMPARISPAAAMTLKGMAAAAGFLTKFTIANRDILKPLIIKGLSGDPATNAVIRTTTAVTGIKSGDTDNVLPGVAEITVNFRLLPGDTIESVMKHVKKQCDGFDTEIEILSGWEASKVSPAGTKGFLRITESLQQIFPTANIVPYVTLGGTDSRNYQTISNNIYRFLPMALTNEERDLMHASGENISLDNYAKMILYFKTLIRNYD